MESISLAYGIDKTLPELSHSVRGISLDYNLRSVILS